MKVKFTENELDSLFHIYLTHEKHVPCEEGYEPKDQAYKDLADLYNRMLKRVEKKYFDNKKASN